MLQIANKTFSSRLFTGTGKFSAAAVMQAALLASSYKGASIISGALINAPDKQQLVNNFTYATNRQ